MEFYKNIAFTIHEIIRTKQPKKEDGKFEPNWQKIYDKEFWDMLKTVEELPDYLRKNEDKFEIDINNADFMKLSPDWQDDYMRIGKYIEMTIQQEEVTGRFPDDKNGQTIYKAWLKLRPELAGSDAVKYIEQYKIARKMFEAKLVDEEVVSIEEVLDFLQKESSDGKNLKFEFWGDNGKYTIYSMYDDIRTSYLKIRGKTKEELLEQ